MGVRTTWRDLGLRVKVLAGVLTVALAGTAALAAVAMTGMGTMNSAAVRIDTQGAQVLAAVGTVRADVVSTEMVVHELMVAIATRDDTSGMAQEIVDHLDAAREGVEQVRTPALADEAQRFLDAWAAYDAAIRDTVLPLLAQGDVPAAGQAMFDGSDAHFDDATAAVQDLSAASAAIAAGERRNADDQYSSTRTRLVLAALAVAALAVGAALLIAREISRPIKASVRALSLVARGDLTQRVRVTSRDELGQLGDALNGTVDATAESVRQVRRSSDLLADVSRRLSDLSEQLSESAERTRSEAVAVGAAAHQVSASAAEAAHGAEEARAAVSEIAASGGAAAASASDAVHQVRETAETVSSLEERSSAITAIVQVINAVADQTHLLALNATIEAARAGHAGAGFAVVAAEVKALAQQTGEATKDIATKIQDIQQDVGMASEAIASITEVVEQVDQMSSTMSAAVEEHSATSLQMTRSMSEVATGSDQITRAAGLVVDEACGTAAAAGTVRDASVELDGVAGQLASSISHFRVAGEDDESIVGD